MALTEVCITDAGVSIDQTPYCNLSVIVHMALWRLFLCDVLLVLEGGENRIIGKSIPFQW